MIDAMVADQGPGILIYRMREHLIWVPALEKLREVATKTWPTAKQTLPGRRGRRPGCESCAHNGVC